MKTLRALAYVCFLVVLPLAGQDTACTYDRCALRLQFRASGVRVVQGAQATSLAKIGFYPPRINILATADDSTRLHYEAFREHHRRSATMGLIALIATAVGTALYYGSDEDAVEWTGVGLSVVGLGFSFGAGANGRRSREDLSQAMWFYNRNLVR